MESRHSTTALLDGLPPGTRALLERVVAAAPGPVFAVGGAVRDLVLGHPLRDLDVAIEGDAIATAAEVASEQGLRITTHARFGTALLRGPGVKVDVAMTRTECYEGPAQLPQVARGSIAEDLARRDFTVNAMAIPLGPPGKLLDPLGGRADASARQIRALHDRSFADDPTRAFRAARYAGRLGFTIEPTTRSWIERDAGFVDLLTPARLRNELELLCSEERSQAGIELCEALGLLGRVDSELALTEPVREAWDHLPESVSAGERPVVRMAMLALALRSPAAVRRLAARLSLRRRYAAAVEAIPGARMALSGIDSPRVRPSEVVAIMEGRPPAVLKAILATTRSPALRLHLASYLDCWGRLRPATPAEGLQSMGLEGKEIGAWLRRLRDARLDGEVDAAGEERWLRQRLR
jgi:tRNA nucleotidyltransferase (CCA-adding enzyme)